MTRRSLLRLARLAVAASLLVTGGLTAQLSHPGTTESKPRSVVGFWTGEDVVVAGQQKPSGPAVYQQPAFRGAFTPAVWEVLHDYRIPLYLNVRYERDFGPGQTDARHETVEFVRKANSLGVPVIAWVVVPYEKGYWAYQGNASLMLEAVKAWASWKDANRLQFDSVALDQEFSYQNLQTFMKNMKSHDPQAMSSWMRGNIDPAAQCKALQTYRELISWAHSHGIRITAAEAPMVVDDLKDGNMALQNALQIADSSPGYDETYLMAYRSAVAASGFDPGSAYIASYYTAMQKYFGAGGQVSIGIPGEAPYDKIEPLVQDVRMLAGMGAKEVPIYSLEEMVAKFGAPGMRAVAEGAQQPLQGEELTRAKIPTPMLKQMLEMSGSQDAEAVKATAALTRDGQPQTPNAWPNGCGNLSVTALGTR